MSKQDKAQKRAEAESWAARLMFLGPVETRAMFGGWAFRLDGVTFGSVMGGVSFRGDASVAEAWEAMGATQFSYVNKRSGKTATMPYWIFSAEALDDQAVLEDLATKALAIARRAKT